MAAHFDKEFHTAKKLAGIIDKNWALFESPIDIKQEFIRAWEEGIEYPAAIAPHRMKLHTSEKNSQIVADSDIAKGICAFPLYLKLHELRTHVLWMAQYYGISTFKSEFKKAAKNGDKPPSWEKWLEAIKSEANDSDTEIMLKDFLTDSGKFYGIKGIRREDFALPAICKSIEMRTDRFGIADQIASATNESIYSKVKEHVEQLD